MNKLEEIIKNAVGVDPSRNDQFSIVNIPFETKDLEDVKVAEPGMFDDVNKWANPLMMILAVAASVFLLRGLMKRLKNQKIVIGTFGGGPDLQLDGYTPSELGAGAKAPQIGSAARKRTCCPWAILKTKYPTRQPRRGFNTIRL